MGIRLTPLVLESAYRFLQNTQPFKSWNLPHADTVVFRVLRTEHMGQCESKNGQHEISISEKKVGHVFTLVETMAHEMTHLKCDREGVRAHHGKDFQRWAKQVCKYHGFDPKAF